MTAKLINRLILLLFQNNLGENIALSILREIEE